MAIRLLKGSLVICGRKEKEWSNLLVNGYFVCTFSLTLLYKYLCKENYFFKITIRKKSACKRLLLNMSESALLKGMSHLMRSVDFPGDSNNQLVYSWHSQNLAIEVCRALITEHKLKNVQDLNRRFSRPHIKLFMLMSFYSPSGLLLSLS